MIKKILKVLMFIVILVFVLVKISYALRSNTGLHISTFSAQPKDTVDVVYIGGSSCFTYWAPMEAWKKYGFTSFNFANNTMPPQIEKYCIIEVLRSQSPSLLIVDVRPFEYGDSIRTTTAQPEAHMIMYEETAIRNITDNIPYSFNRIQMIENSISEDDNSFNYHFDIAKYHTRYNVLLGNPNWQYPYSESEDDTMDYGGFEFYIRYDSETVLRDYRNIVEALPLSDTLDIIYRDLSQYCSDLDTDVLFIVPPYQESEDNHKKHNYMAVVAAEYGIDFLDCNNIYEEIGLDEETDYYNGSHTNIFGAKKYTKWLGEYLVDRYDLPNKRDDISYDYWERAYDIWELESAKAELALYELMPEGAQAKLLEEIQ